MGRQIPMYGLESYHKYIQEPWGDRLAQLDIGRARLPIPWANNVKYLGLHLDFRLTLQNPVPFPGKLYID